MSKNHVEFVELRWHTYEVLLFGNTVFSFHVGDFREDNRYFGRLFGWHRFIVNAQKHHRQVVVWAGIFLGFDAIPIGDVAEQFVDFEVFPRLLARHPTFHVAQISMQKNRLQ